jgi:hypothetical protein
MFPKSKQHRVLVLGDFVYGKHGLDPQLLGAGQRLLRRCGWSHAGLPREPENSGGVFQVGFEQ